MRLSTMFLILAAIQFALVITAQGTYNEETPFWVAAQNPSNWQAIVITALFGGTIAAVGTSVVVVGSLVMHKPDLAVFAPAVGMMIGWFIPIVSLWRIIVAELGYIGEGVYWIAGLAISPLLILGFYAAITWWRTTFEG